MEKFVSSIAAVIRTGLLITIGFFCISVFAETIVTESQQSHRPWIYVLFSAKTCNVGEPVSLEIVVADESQTITALELPPVPAGVSLEDLTYLHRPSFPQYAKIEGFPQNCTQVLVRSCSYVCSATGSYSLGPVSVRTRSGEEYFATVPVLVCTVPDEDLPVELFWQSVFSELTVGVPAELILCARNIPQNVVVTAELPENAFIEVLPSPAGALYACRLTALEPGFCVLPTVSIRWNLPDGQAATAISPWQKLPVFDVSASTGVKFQKVFIKTETTVSATAHQSSSVIESKKMRLSTGVTVATGIIAVLSALAAVVTGITSGLSCKDDLLKKRSKWVVVQIIFFCTCTILAGITCGIRIHKIVIFNQRLAVNAPRLYFIPEESNGTYVDLPTDTVFFKRKSINNWFYVETADGKKGWIPAKNIVNTIGVD